MKHIAVIVVAAFSFLIAIPIAHQPAQQHKLDFKLLSDKKVAVKAISKSTNITPKIVKTVISPPPAAPPPAPTPSPSPPPPKIETSAANLCASYAPLFSQYGWNTDIAMAICSAESRGNPNAASPTDDFGLMQINHGYEIYGSAIYDPAFNIKIAYTVKYLGNGWNPWTTWLTGAYIRYL